VFQKSRTAVKVKSKTQDRNDDKTLETELEHKAQFTDRRGGEKRFTLTDKTFGISYKQKRTTRQPVIGLLRQSLRHDAEHRGERQSPLDRGRQQPIQEP